MKVYLQGFTKIPRGKKLEVIHVASSIFALKALRATEPSQPHEPGHLLRCTLLLSGLVFLRRSTPLCKAVSLLPNCSSGSAPTEGGAPRLSPCREILILRVKTSNRGCSWNATMSLFNHVFCILWHFDILGASLTGKRWPLPWQQILPFFWVWIFFFPTFFLYWGIAN